MHWLAKASCMETFGQIIGAEKPVLVDFTAAWCGPCKMMAPELQKYARGNQDRVRVLKVDVDRNPDTAARFSIQGVPTLILFKKGQVLWRQSGAMSASQISEAVNSRI